MLTFAHYVVCKIVMSLGTGATEEDGAIVSKLFGSVGKILRADEKMFDAVTGLRYIKPLRFLKCFNCSSHLSSNHVLNFFENFKLFTVEVDQHTYS